MEEEKHRAEGLERILPTGHRRATERQEQQAIVSFEFCLLSYRGIRRKVERRTDKSSAFFFVVRPAQDFRVVGWSAGHFSQDNNQYM